MPVVKKGSKMTKNHENRLFQLNNIVFQDSFPDTTFRVFHHLKMTQNTKYAEMNKMTKLKKHVLIPSLGHA